MPPPSETKTRLTKLIDIFAPSVAMIKSHASAMSRPKPNAAPFIAAITGFVIP